MPSGAPGFAGFAWRHRPAPAECIAADSRHAPPVRRGLPLTSRASHHFPSDHPLSNHRITRSATIDSHPDSFEPLGLWLARAFAGDDTIADRTRRSLGSSCFLSSWSTSTSERRRPLRSTAVARASIGRASTRRAAARSAPSRACASTSPRCTPHRAPGCAASAARTAGRRRRARCTRRRARRTWRRANARSAAAAAGWPCARASCTAAATWCATTVESASGPGRAPRASEASRCCRTTNGSPR